MKSCERCGSMAINPTQHGREPGVDEHLCDVCYWRLRVENMFPYPYKKYIEADGVRRRVLDRFFPLSAK
jgi:hypothetical protein